MKILYTFNLLIARNETAEALNSISLFILISESDCLGLASVSTTTASNLEEPTKKKNLFNNNYYLLSVANFFHFPKKIINWNEVKVGWFNMFWNCLFLSKISYLLRTVLVSNNNCLILIKKMIETSLLVAASGATTILNNLLLLFIPSASRDEYYQSILMLLNWKLSSCEFFF